MLKKNWLLVLLTVLLGLTVSVYTVGCGDDDEGGEGEGEGEGEEGEGEGENDDDDTVETVDFKGTLIAFGSGSPGTPVPGMEVTVYDNDTGTATTTKTKSGDDGTVEFKGLPKGKVGFKVTGVTGQFRDTYQYNIDAGAQDETLWIVPENVWTMAPAGAGLTVNAGEAIAAGAIYWVDSSGKEFPVCGATIESDVGGNIRYFGDNGLPTTLENQPSVNKTNGYYLVANIEPSKITLTGKVDGTVVGTTTFYTAADSVSIGNIYTDASFTSNPGKCD
ncbi:MAG: hypothetical protein Kow0090_02910 [Myxococcota bacterium]